MLFRDITMVDENMNVREGMYLGTEGKNITYISDVPPSDSARFGESYPHTKDMLFLPAFVNAHAHTPMQLMRGYGENLSLMDWLNTRIFPFEAKWKADDIYYASMSEAAEMLRFGIATTNDMYYYASSVLKAAYESGIKTNFSLGTVCFDGSEFTSLPVYTETLEAIKSYNGLDGRLTVDFCLHAEYTNTEKTARGVAEAAKEYGTGVHVHVSETADEVKQCRERHSGRSPVRFLNDCGMFDVPTVAAHCVHIDGDDIGILKEKNVTVATCATSNLKLASGICPVPELMRRGVNVAIGTDSVASNNNLNMIEEMKLFALIHKGISGDPTVIMPSQALYAATGAGAKALRRTDSGRLSVGCRADITAVDISQIYMKPCNDMLSNLVYSSCGSDVRMTMCDGRVLYDNGEYKTIDIEKVTSECERSRKRIISEL